MNLCVAYTAVHNGPITLEYCARFVTTWHEFGPGVETDLIVICNGGPLTCEQSILFSGLNAKMFVRSNDGWDIGGYMEAARGPCEEYDAVLWTGESNYFHRAGWFKRLAESFERHGPGFYGPYSSNAVRSHLNTTAFFCAPIVLRQYPKRVLTRQDRYEAEHGENSIWRRVASQGRPVRMVTWDGEWEPRMWRMPTNIIWRGDQSNCLMWCNHCDGYANLDAARKTHWARQWDQPFK
jgi:hypothetical protein